MTSVDQFESVFRAAAKARYVHKDVPIERIVCVTDMEEDRAERFTLAVKGFLSGLGDHVQWETVTGAEFGNVEELLRLIETRRPSLTVTYRHLHSDAWKWPFSLGVYLDVMTQVAGCPVLVVPHPDREGVPEHAMQNTDSVVAITDHLTADDRLVRFATRFTAKHGNLWLTHVEDETTFQRYVEVVSREPDIDTETFADDIRQRLLKEPTDYIKACRQALAAAKVDVQVREEVVIGHSLAEHRRLVEEHDVDLVVMNTKDDDQFAMHGLAYALAVELRSVPLLML